MKNVYAFGLSACLSVRLSMHTLNFVNILEISLNSYMLFIPDIECAALKMICMGLRIYLHRHTKAFRYILAYGWKILKHILTHLYCTKYNEIDMRHSGIQNHVSYEK